MIFNLLKKNQFRESLKCGQQYTAVCDMRKKPVVCNMREKPPAVSHMRKKPPMRKIPGALQLEQQCRPERCVISSVCLISEDAMITEGMPQGK